MSTTSSIPTPRLTSLSHGGGCGCKLAPGLLADLLKGSPAATPFASLLVGSETADDAAVYQLNDEQAVVATTDFFMPIPGVHAITDVTGFGLLGHLLEMCRGARLGARLSMSRVPLLDNVLAMAAAGCVTGASARNWASYGDEVQPAPELEPAHRALCDPQTSGGLLIACAQEAVPEAMRTLQHHGFMQAAVIGTMTDERPIVRVEA